MTSMSSTKTYLYKNNRNVIISRSPCNYFHFVCWCKVLRFLTLIIIFIFCSMNCTDSQIWVIYCCVLYIL